MTYASPTSVDVSSGFLNILYYVNDLTQNWLGQGTIIAIYILIAIGYYKGSDDFAAAMAVSGFVTFIITLLFWISGFVSGWFFGGVIGIMIIGVLLVLSDNN